MSFLSKIAGWFTSAGVSVAHLRKQYERHQQELHRNCIAIASAAGKPRGLLWSHQQWLTSWVLVEDTATGLVTMLHGVNLSFEAVEGGEMEDVDAVSTVRDATAVFHFQNGRWGTGGRVLFNMSPESAVQSLGDDLKILDSSN